MILTTIKAMDIPDAWFQCLYKLMDCGYRYKINKGSFKGEERIELDHTVICIYKPYNEPYNLMLPQIPKELGIPDPVASDYVEEYLPYLLTDHIEPDESYTYGSRIYNQVIYWTHQLKRTPNTNQAVLQVAQPLDYLLKDPPCLRQIDMRVKDNQLIFYPEFRSWDLWAGFPANLAGITVLQHTMATDIGVTVGPIIARSKGLHIYGYAEELAKIRTYRQ